MLVQAPNGLNIANIIIIAVAVLVGLILFALIIRLIIQRSESHRRLRKTNFATGVQRQLAPAPSAPTASKRSRKPLAKTPALPPPPSPYGRPLPPLQSQPQAPAQPSPAPAPPPDPLPPQPEPPTRPQPLPDPFTPQPDPSPQPFPPQPEPVPHPEPQPQPEPVPQPEPQPDPFPSPPPPQPEPVPTPEPQPEPPSFEASGSDDVPTSADSIFGADPILGNIDVDAVVSLVSDPEPIQQDQGFYVIEEDDVPLEELIEKIDVDDLPSTYIPLDDNWATVDTTDEFRAVHEQFDAHDSAHHVGWDFDEGQPSYAGLDAVYINLDDIDGFGDLDVLQGTSLTDRLILHEYDAFSDPVEVPQDESVQTVDAGATNDAVQAEDDAEIDDAVYFIADEKHVEQQTPFEPDDPEQLADRLITEHTVPRSPFAMSSPTGLFGSGLSHETVDVESSTEETHHTELLDTQLHDVDTHDSESNNPVESNVSSSERESGDLDGAGFLRYGPGADDASAQDPSADDLEADRLSGVASFESNTQGRGVRSGGHNDESNPGSTPSLFGVSRTASHTSDVVDSGTNTKETQLNSKHKGAQHDAEADWTVGDRRSSPDKPLVIMRDESATQRHNGSRHNTNGQDQQSPKAEAPGWYPDPHHAGQLRWWDGKYWTDETS